MHRIQLAALVVLTLPGVSAVNLRHLAPTPNASAQILVKDVDRQATVVGELGNNTEHGETRAVHAALSENREDAEGWQLGTPHHSFANGIAPPKCPADVTPDSPYMTEVVEPDYAHTYCKYRHKEGEYSPCNRKGTNLERLDSLRGLLVRTKKLLNDHEIPYALYGGSAIGQHRCRDVLPWDSDCDVIVWMQDVHRIPVGDLDEQYTVVHKADDVSGIPYNVVDKKTGFFCDVFFMNLNPQTQKVGMAWPWAHDVCPEFETSPPFSSSYGNKACDKFDANIVQAFVPCVLHGVDHMCFKDQAAYLEQAYGPDTLLEPNVKTQKGGGAHTHPGALSAHIPLARHPH